MKKHEACYWLNVIADGLRDERQHHREKLGTEAEELEEHEKSWREKRTKMIDHQLDAIEIAAEALTKR